MERDCAPLGPDAWLSRLLGKPCFRLRPEMHEFGPDDLPREPSFIAASVPVGDTTALLRLQGLGFRVVDVNVQFSRPAVPLAAPASVAVRFARPEDSPGVRRVARSSFLYDRFHRDPAIGAALAGRIKEEWAANYFAGGRGDWMVVAEHDGLVIGFLQLLAGEGDSVVIDLVAVEEKWRGRGVAKSMIAFASLGCRGKPVPLRVGTQLANEASLRLYTGLGFRIASAFYILHWH